MENSKTNKKPITDEERLELAAKLDRELDEFISGLEKKPYTEGWPEDKWEEEMEKHPFFMKKPPEPGCDLHPLYEGLQQLKYDPNENTAEELAISYKEDGNFNFKHKNYRLAIIAYTEGIKTKCGNKEIQATLLNNRAAANFYLKNYRSCLRDCELALRIKPDYEKVKLRAIHCCYEIKQFEKATKYCDEILKTNKNNNEVQELKQKCLKAEKLKDRDNRMKERKENKKEKEHANLVKTVKSKVNAIYEDRGDLKIDDLVPVLPQLRDHRVHLNEDGKLVWPVVFMYPEYKVMDFVQEFTEDERFINHLCNIFENKPSWDVESKYQPHNLNVCFQDHNTNKIHAVDVTETLGNMLKQPWFTIQGGAPAFLIVVKGSKAESELLNTTCNISK